MKYKKSNFQCLVRGLECAWVKAVLILAFSHSVFGAGILDQSFGNGGKVSFRLGATSDSARSAVLQADGKIVVAGQTIPSGQSTGLRDFIVARLNVNGSLDDTFGSGGLVVTAFGFQNEDIANSVVVQPNGKIIAAGSSAGVFALARYNPDGSPDNSFGSGGKVTTSFPGTSGAQILFLFLQADGKILAVGSSSSPVGSTEGQRQIAVARYTDDGNLDPAFGDNGRLKIFFGSIITGIDGAAMQPDGKLLISGRYAFIRPNCTPTKTNDCSDGVEFLVRYNQNMSLDKKFGRRFGKEFSRDKFYGLSLQSDGGILVGGFPIIRRYSVNGRLEATFDRAVFPNQPPDQFTLNGPSRLKQRSNGTIIGCQKLRAVGHDDIGVVLFDAASRAIAYDQRDFFGANDICSDTLIQSDQKIIIIGSAQLEAQGNYSIAVMRYLDITP